MKYISPVLNFILLVAVIILYVLHFRNVPVSESGKDLTVPIPALTNTQGGIVFLNSDSLLNQYEFFKKKKAEFEEHQDKVKNELKSEQEKLQKQADEYQQQASGMSEMQRQQSEEQLMAKQQKLMQRKDELMGLLDAEQEKSTDEVHARINSFLKEMNHDNKFIYVLGYQKGGGILYANDKLDITEPVITGLNKAYSEETMK